MNATGRTIRISDPSVSLERIWVRIYESELRLADYEAHGWSYLARCERRRIAALKGASTRIGRLI